VQGFAPRPVLKGRKLEQTDKPDRSWPLQFYSFVPEVSQPKVIDQSSTRITKFEPDIDEGWLCVRAHSDEATALEYCEGVAAAQDKFDYPYACRVAVTAQGIFSLYHRDTARQACPDHLIIYTDQACSQFEWCHIVKSDGSMSNYFGLTMGLVEPK
jgi:hypothetical protein